MKNENNEPMILKNDFSDVKTGDLLFEYTKNLTGKVIEVGVYKTGQCYKQQFPFIKVEFYNVGQIYVNIYDLNGVEYRTHNGIILKCQAFANKLPTIFRTKWWY